MLVALVLVLLTPRATDEALVLHVSPHGDDAATGQPGQGAGAGPFVTLARAREAVRAAPPDRDVVVLVHPGTYRLEETLTLGPADGGAGRRTVTWRSKTPGAAVLSGGAPLAAWTVEEDGTWSHASPGVRQLFVGEERLPSARFPREGWLRVASAEPGARDAFRASDGLPPAASLLGAQVRLVHDWSTSLVPLERLGADGSVRLARPVGAWHPFFHLTGFEQHPRYAFENVRAGWDVPGEWLDDHAAGRLRYRPRRGETPRATDVLAPALPCLIAIEGTAEEPVLGLRFEGLSLRHSAALLHPQGYAGIQAAFHEDREAGPGVRRARAPAGAVRVEHAGDFRFVGCEFMQLGGAALVIGRGAHDGLVRRCRVADVGANGIMVGEPSYPPAHPEAVELVRDITVEDSTLERCGALDPGAVGLWIGLSARVHVRHNELRDLPYTGISLGWIWSDEPSPSRGHRIERNHIHHVMQVLSDGGGIYTLGRQPDTHVVGNLVHDVPPHLGRAPSNGVFVDQGSTELLFRGNVLHSIAGAPIRFHMAGGNRLEENLLVTAGAPFTYNACSAEAMIFEANTVVDPEGWLPSDLPVGPR